ncbi:adenylate kinase isoenzyme 1-like isoform 1-T2 [Sarcophilus harrisii]
MCQLHTQASLPSSSRSPDLLKSYRIIFVMGGPGCGKGTQCENMAAKYGFCHVGLGELLREEANQATVRGQLIRDIMLKGLLVPTGVILDMVSDNMLSRPESKGFLIDGFPRELSQAKEFERIICFVLEKSPLWGLGQEVECEEGARHQVAEDLNQAVQMQPAQNLPISGQRTGNCKTERSFYSLESSSSLSSIY